MAMQLDIIKTQTTWNDAAASLNNNFSKINRAVRDGIPVVNTPVDEEMSDTSTNAVQNKVIKKYIDDYDVYLEGYAEQQAIDAEKAAKQYTDEKIAQIEIEGGMSQENADKRYIRKVVDNFDSDLTFAVADGIVGTDDEYYFLPAKAPSTASDSQILATKADVNQGGGSIDPALLEGYMPMMREFSDDFNNDFSR